jgi:HTH-type transcriptional regulator / antitoxin HipB
MNIAIRTSKQAGDAIRRVRRQRAFSQKTLGEKMHARQATVSKLESGEATTQIRTLMDALAALDLELVIRPRIIAKPADIEDIF